MPHPDEPTPVVTVGGSHPDADDLALVALGENLGADVHAHISACATCTAQVESFHDTIELAGLSDYGRDAPAPGEHVWAAIAADLGFDDLADGAEPDAVAPGQGAGFGFGFERTGPRLTAVPDAVDPVPDVVSTTDPTPAPAPVPSAAPAPVPAPADPGPPTALPRRRNRWVAPIAAAVVGIALGAGAVVVVQNRESAVVVDATAPLTPVQGGPLPTSDGQLGTAELVTARTGQQVRIDAAALPAAATSAYEVWLFGDDGRMVSLGTLADGSGSFTVPAGIDTTQYRTVDISDEPPDGNPAHSGISLIRGTFA